MITEQGIDKVMRLLPGDLDDIQIECQNRQCDGFADYILQLSDSVDTFLCFRCSAMALIK